MGLCIEHHSGVRPVWPVSRAKTLCQGDHCFPHGGLPRGASSAPKCASHARRQTTKVVVVVFQAVGAAPGTNSQVVEIDTRFERPVNRGNVTECRLDRVQIFRSPEIIDRTVRFGCQIVRTNQPVKLLSLAGLRLR